MVEDLVKMVKNGTPPVRYERGTTGQLSEQYQRESAEGEACSRWRVNGCVERARAFYLCIVKKITAMSGLMKQGNGRDAVEEENRR